MIEIRFATSQDYTYLVHNDLMVQMELRLLILKNSIS